MLYELLYSSRANEEFSTSQLVELLESCRRHNAEDDVTGMLTYHNRTFIQLLEGPESTLRSLVDKIAADPRHANVRVLWEGPIADRGFDEWSMGFKSLDALKSAKATEYRKQLDDGLANGLWADNPSTARALLRSLNML